MLVVPSSFKVICYAAIDNRPPLSDTSKVPGSVLSTFTHDLVSFQCVSSSPGNWVKTHSYRFRKLRERFSYLYF